LTDLLDCLNKSSMENVPNETDGKGNSTASETGASNSDIKTPPINELKLKQTKSALETPKSKKLNPWKAITVQN
jgi:hypothetical protein